MPQAAGLLLGSSLETVILLSADCKLGPGGGVLPYKGLMGTFGQPGYVFRNFCLKQGIEFINFCLKQDIFSWTMNSKIFTSSC